MSAKNQQSSAAEAAREANADFWPVKGDGKLTTEPRSPGAFTQVRNETPLAVSISEGSPSVSVTVDSNLQSLLLTTVTNGVLCITTQKNILPSQGSQVVLSLSGLEGLTLTGFGAMTANVTTVAATLALNLTGLGALTFTGNAQAVNATKSGPGDMKLIGSAKSLSATLSGPGTLDAQFLPISGDAQLTNSGPGRLIATVNGTVSFDLSGPGDIDWYGTATTKSTSHTGSGHINHKG